ncbi:N-glycosylase/DNA lyase [Desulfurobacterium sp.]
MGKRVNLEIHPERAKKVAKVLVKRLEKGGIFSFKELPDDEIKKVPLKDREKLIAVLSLVTALDYMRDAKKLWESAVETLKDKELQWIFSPKEVVKRGRNELKKALLKHRIAMRKDKDTDIWWNISQTIAGEFGGSFLSFFDSFNYMVDETYRKIDDKKWHEKFPNLSGRKIFPHWIRILKEKVEDLPFENVGKLPIPVDVHVTRATFTTGCITGSYRAKSITATVRKLVIKVWDEALKDEGIPPVSMFRPLWLLSKHGCHYRKNGDCPKRGECPVRHFCVSGKVVVSASHVEIDTSL